MNGYVLLKGIFSPAECQRFIDLADQMDADDACTYKHDGYPKSPTLTVLSRCAWYHPHLLETAMHSTLLPIIEDVVGGEVRLEEHQYQGGQFPKITMLIISFKDSLAEQTT